MANSAVSNNMAKQAVPEDGKVYFITNKKYYHARLAQWGTKGREMGTYEDKVYPDQLWVLKEDEFEKGWFYIENTHNAGYRLAKWGKEGKETGIFHGKYYPDQLWKFVPAEEGFYYIYNKQYPDDRLAKWGKGDGDWGTYPFAKFEDQLWFFTPRFEADITYTTLWQADNRQGSQDLSERKKVTVGLKLTKSESLSTTVSLTTSLEAALDGVFGASMELKTEISKTLATGSEKSWVTENEITFTAPAGKNYRIKQPEASFKSLLNDDDCVFSGSYIVEESTEPFED